MNLNRVCTAAAMTAALGLSVSSAQATLTINNQTYIHPDDSSSATVTDTGNLNIHKKPGDDSTDSTFEIQSGSYTFENDLQTGVLSGSGATARLTASGGTLTLGNSRKGSEHQLAGSKGEASTDVNLTGGDVSMTGGLLVATTSDGSVVPGPIDIDLTAGSLNVQGYKAALVLGESNYGSSVPITMNQSGGDATYGGSVVIGNKANIDASYTISGGSFKIEQGVTDSYGSLSVGGSAGEGTFHVDGAGSSSIDVLKNVKVKDTGTLQFTFDSSNTTTITANKLIINAAGTVDLGLDGYTPAVGDTFDLLTAPSSGDLTYSASNLAAEDTDNWLLKDDGSGTFQAEYIGVPEPASLALLGLGGGLLLLGRRRRD